jgi:hypothetical protein
LNDGEAVYVIARLRVIKCQACGLDKIKSDPIGPLLILADDYNFDTKQCFIISLLFQFDKKISVQ